MSGYAFYAFYDIRFLPVLAGVSLAAYLSALGIERSGSAKARKMFMLAGITACAGSLVVFKALNFSYSGFVLPLGISFYVFISLSYIIDVHSRKIKACTNLTDGLLVLSFFPLLLAGPVQKPASLIPQIQTPRVFDYESAAAGLRRILWGLFLKLLIADNLAVFADEIFSNYSNYGGSTLLIGAVFYSIQIYSDFAGYSEMAIGVSGLLGIKLVRNFKYPYFAADITDFWRRWHISLTVWFRDYIFLPFSFYLSRRIKEERFMGMNTDMFIYTAGLALTWMLTGLWHGTGITFAVWGILNAVLLFGYHLLKKQRKRLIKRLSGGYGNLLFNISERIFTLASIMFLWIIFRSDSIAQAESYISGIFSSSLFSAPEFSGIRRINPALIASAAMFIIEFIGRNDEYAIEKFLMNRKKAIRWGFYVILVLAIYFFGNYSSGIEFIYFQF